MSQAFILLLVHVNILSTLEWSSIDIQSQKRNGIAKFARFIEVEDRLYEISIPIFISQKWGVIVLESWVTISNNAGRISEFSHEKFLWECEKSSKLPVGIIEKFDNLPSSFTVNCSLVCIDIYHIRNINMKEIIQKLEQTGKGYTVYCRLTIKRHWLNKFVSRSFICPFL